MTTPPQEWPTRMTGPVCRASVRLVGATSEDRFRSTRTNPSIKSCRNIDGVSLGPPVASVLRGPRALHVKHVCRDEQWKCGQAQRPREPARNMNETRDQKRPDDLAY